MPTLISTPASTLAPQPSPAVPAAAFRYWGFISYSQRDAEWAKKLHGFLETYRIPRALVGRKTDAGTIPRRLVPIFRDRDELGGSGDLGATLLEALTESGSLIVICSPAAAASRWVDEEIRLYKAMGRTGRVFPLIIAGEPNASDGGDPAAECFPRSLRHVVDRDGVVTDRRAEPLAADARAGKDDWEDACLRLVAGILDVGFDDLRQREALRQRRRRVVRALTTLTGVLLLAVAYLGLADADVPVPAGEGLRTRLDSVGWTVFRPVLSQAEMDGRARSIRGALRRRLMDGVAAGEVDRDNPISPWLIGQVIGAAYRDPGAPADELKPLLQLFDLTHGTPTLDRAGDLKSIRPDSAETRPTAPLQALGAAARAEHKFWVIMALAAVLARPELLNPDEVERFKQYLRIAQQRADVHYPLANGGWNTAPRQVNPANHFTYTSGLALHAMLEVYAAGLGWHDSRERLAQMITETSRWLNDAFVQDGGRSGWRISVDDDRLPESGTSLFIHAALGRACAVAGIPIADNVRDAALGLQAGLRHRTYDSVDPDIRFDVRVVEDNGAVTGQVTVTRMIWYPWAVEGLTAWRRCAEKNGYAPEVRRALDRSLGHLLADVAPDVLRDVTRRQRQLFVTAETYYGLGKAP